MKAKIHPEYVQATVHCASCGTTWETRATKPDLRVEHGHRLSQARRTDPRARAAAGWRLYGPLAPPASRTRHHRHVGNPGTRYPRAGLFLERRDGPAR